MVNLTGNATNIHPRFPAAPGFEASPFSESPNCDGGHSAARRPGLGRPAPIQANSNGTRMTMLSIRFGVRRWATAATVAVAIMAPWAGASAQMSFPVPGGGGMGSGMSGGGCADYVKSSLVITDAQKGPWDAYA